MVETKLDLAMSNRGGFPVKNVLYAVFLMFLVYLVYLYHGSQTQLKETEMTVARYRREASDRVTEIQDMIKSKDELQELCQKEKHEAANKLKGLKEQNQMIQSQFKETEADFLKLKSDMENMRSEHQQSETQHSTEYQQFKQQKEMEISDLKDQLHNSKQHNDDLARSVSVLQQQIQQYQDSHQKLVSQNTLLQDELQKQQTFNQQQQQQLLLQHQQNQQAQQFAGANQAHGGEQAGNFVNNMKIGGQAQQGLPHGVLESLDSKQGGLADLQPGHLAGDDTLAKEIEKAVPQQLEHINAQHQVAPPHDNEVADDKDSAAVDVDKNVAAVDGNDEQVNPNDLQKVQIQEPNLDNLDKQDDGGEKDGERHMDIGNIEEARAKDALQEEEEGGDGGDGLLKPQNPLALGQLEQPHGGGAGQQQPPLLPDNNDDHNERANEDVYNYDDGDKDGNGKEDEEM